MIDRYSLSLNRLRSLPGDRSGATAISFALLGTVLLGFIGLGIDLGSAYYTRRQAQNAADSAAVSAAMILASAGSTISDEARAVAARYGFSHGTNDVLVNVSAPPSSGAHAGSSQAVEVIIERPARRFFSGLFVTGSPHMIRARAVGRVRPSGNACVVALNSTAQASALETGSADINLEGCSLYSNSSSSAAFALKGAAALRADSVNVVGGYSVGNNATLTTVNGVHTQQAPIADPYRDVAIPSYSGCTYNGASLASGTYGGGSWPTVFCNGLQLNSGVSVTLRPGVYIIDRGSLSVNGGATLKGSGVTIVLTSSTGSNYATAQVNGKAVVDLAAPTSGPLAGLVFYQDRRAPEGVNNLLAGGSTQVLRGAVYFPSQIVTFTGGSATSTNGCLQLIANQIAFRGNATLQMKCDGSGVRRAGGSSVSLVE